MYQAVNAGYLRPRDILICDNAAIHARAKTLADLQELLEMHCIELCFLPAYSPEVDLSFSLISLYQFNPCELVFGYVKIYLRNYQGSSVELEEDICTSFACVTPEFMVKYFGPS